MHFQKKADTEQTEEKKKDSGLGYPSLYESIEHFWFRNVWNFEGRLPFFRTL